MSRVARVTGLDRSGIEVACAVRPRGHVLQVTNGKGRTAHVAAQGALLEAAELWCSEHVEPLPMASLAQLRAAGAWAWGMDDLGSAGELVDPALWSESVVCAWREGVELLTGRTVAVPAAALHCPPPGSALLGPAAVRWSSNGMGAHPDADAALQHALFEAVERHCLAHALPHGFRPAELASRGLTSAALERSAPGARELAQQLSARGLTPFLFDLSTALQVPVAGALLVDAEEGPIPVTAGYASAGDWDHALQSALLEAAQSRLTDVHGAREDIAPMEPDSVRRLTDMLRRTQPKARAPRCRNLPRKGLVPHLRRQGVARIAAVELSPPGFPVHVFKAVVPGFVVSGML